MRLTDQFGLATPSILQPFLNCGYMNTCFKCGQKFLCKGHKDQFSTFETCIHITAFKTLLYIKKIVGKE